jgi:hypothetical protein
MANMILVWKNAAKKELWMRYHLGYAKNELINYSVLDPWMFTRDDSHAASSEGDVSESDDSGEENDEEDLERQEIWDNAPRWENIDYGDSYKGTTRPSYIPARINDAKYENLVTTAFNSVHVGGVWSNFPPQSSHPWRRTVIIDLDRNVLTVDGKKHFRLPKFPKSFLTKENGQRQLPNVYLPPPIPDPELVALYNSSSPSIIESKMLLPDSNRSRRIVVSYLIKDFLRRYYTNQNFYMEECRPTDVPFQILAYACIKLASLDKILLKEVKEPFSYPSYRYDDENWEGLRYIKPPPSDMYTVPGGKYGEVLILLAHHSISEDPESEIGRVIKYAQTSNRQYVTACIFSIETVIYVDVALESTGPRVSHTLPSIGDMFEGWGRELLASALVPDAISYFDHILPQEIILQIFHYLCYSKPEIKDILNWRLTCRAFKDIVDRLTIPFEPAIILNFPNRYRDAVLVLDDSGYIDDYIVGDFDIRPTKWKAYDRETGKPIGMCMLTAVTD